MLGGDFRHDQVELVRKTGIPRFNLGCLIVFIVSVVLVIAMYSCMALVREDEPKCDTLGKDGAPVSVPCETPVTEE